MISGIDVLKLAYGYSGYQQLRDYRWVHYASAEKDRSQTIQSSTSGKNSRQEHSIDKATIISYQPSHFKFHLEKK